MLWKNKAYFEVNICDKEKADEFVKIFGKMNGSGFQPDKNAKRRQGFISSSFIISRKGKELREKGKLLSSSDNYKLFKCTNKHQLEDEGTMVAGVFDFKDRDEGDGSCFKMQVKLNYDHNHEMTSCDAWNFLEVYQDTK